MDRFNSVILYEVHGHIHLEDWNVGRSIGGKRPLRMSFMVASATTYQNKPPSFSVMYLDKKTLLPVDYETYYFDLDRANSNLENKPEWKVHHSLRQTYNLKDLSPSSFLKYSAKILSDEKAAIKYRSNRFIGHLGYETSKSKCDADCRLKYFCITTANSYDDWQQ